VSPVGGKVTEKELRETLVRAARNFGWRVYFTWSSMHSPAGFPDLCMVKGDRLVFAELKTEKGKVTPEQQAWLDALEACRLGAQERVTQGHAPEVYVWRPADLDAAYRVLMS
jgi:hypothetical protein